MNLDDSPLAGLTVVERSSTVAAAYAGRLLSTLGARTILVEPPTGHLLRQRGSMLGNDVSSVFAYLSAGKESVSCDVTSPAGRERLQSLLAKADVYLDDATSEERAVVDLDDEGVLTTHPGLTFVSVRPFGLHGPKAGWLGEEINLFHASGEGTLLPNGLAHERHPDRSPLKVFGYFAEMQGGVAAALAALGSLLSGVGQLVDVSVQDAAVAVGAFTIQRHGDGAVEHRSTRSFAYGGVLECRDGFVELLTLEERQWRGLVELLGAPEWASSSELDDAVGRSMHGAQINRELRAWAREHGAEELVARAQQLGVPVAKYARPEEVLTGAHEAHRRLFQQVLVPGVGDLATLVSPFHIDGGPLELVGGPPPMPSGGVFVEESSLSRSGVPR